MRRFTGKLALSMLLTISAGTCWAQVASNYPAKRSPSVPQLLTIAEAAIPGFALDQWYSLFAPAGTPKEIVAKLHGKIAKMVAHAGFFARAPLCCQW